MTQDTVLRRIREALEVKAGNPTRESAVADRLTKPRRNLVPASAKVSGELAIARFTQALQEESADVLAAPAYADVPKIVGSYLAHLMLPPSIRFGSEPAFAGLDWRGANVTRQDEAQAGLSMALAGAAETGTLFLVSGPDNPTSLAFLPETHLVTVARNMIVGAYEDAFDLVRQRFGPNTLPRSLNLISAPSRTGDIGGLIVLGAHGPRRLAVVIVG